jgi:hypothetical protein
MKPTPFTKASALALLSTAALFCQASASVEVAAEVVTSHEKKEAPAEKEEKKPGMAAKPTSQEKALRITVKSSKPESGATVRYWFVGRDMKTNKVALLDGGESPANLKGTADEIIVTKAVKVAKPKPPAAAKPGAKPGATATPGGPDSTKLAGYGVQVIKENAVIAEFFSEPGVKQIIGSNGKAPGALFQASEPEAK